MSARTPGKTTLLNAYRLPGFYLLDLPGYGFARAAKSAREGYRRLVTRCLRERPTLAGVVWLLDIRHDPSKDDLEMQQLLIRSGRPVLRRSPRPTSSGAVCREPGARVRRGPGHSRWIRFRSPAPAPDSAVQDLAASIVAAVGGNP